MFSTLPDFRPIRLLRSPFKILAKVLANILKHFLPKLISPSQSTSVEGRQIMDAVITAHKCTDSQHKARRKGIICKLDLEKAYYMVDWHFLHFVLSSMGFSRKWCL